MGPACERVEPARVRAALQLFPGSGVSITASLGEGRQVSPGAKLELVRSSRSCPLHWEPPHSSACHPQTERSWDELLQKGDPQPWLLQV